MGIDRDRLAREAAELLRHNDRGAYTVPSPHLYPHQWAWDSAFAAIGWAHLDLDRAVTELETLMHGAWPDGRVPHIRFHDLTGSYFPGPAFWGTTDSSSITQPPAWALAARRLLELGADTHRLAALVPAIDASHRFFFEARDPEGINAVCVVHPWESGMDNSPAWDPPLDAVDPSQAPPFRRVDKERVADAGQRPSDDEYARYAVLVKAIAEDDFGPGPFRVYDPGMTAILARAEQDLAWLGERLGVETAAGDRAVRLLSGLERLWSPQHGRYVFRDAAADRVVPADQIACALPLMLSDLPAERAATLRAGLTARFDTEWPLPSTAPGDPGFDPVRYWRGPVWINVNWLLADAVGGPLAERSLALMARSGFREYFDPRDGAGLGATDFTWSAALALDWLRR